MRDTEDFLKSFHEQNPGCSTNAFECLRDAEGLSPYDRLARSAKPGLRVLDIACGDGWLMEKMSAAAEVIGLDMSVDELFAARRRLGPSARLIEGRTQQIPLPDASVDLVTCHMAFMLMNDIEQVIREIRRVLERGGTFSAIVNSAGPRPTSFSESFVQNLKEALAAEGDHGPLGQIGDPRVRRLDGFKGLFREGFDADVQERVFSSAQPLDFALGYYTGTYDVWRLSPAGREKFRDALRAPLSAEADAQGRVLVQLQTLHLTAVKSS